jgi:hypothetical protein
MKTLAAPETPETALGWQTVEELRAVLRALGADGDLLRRIVLRTDVGDRQYAALPPLPTDLVERLAQLRPGEAATC